MIRKEDIENVIEHQITEKGIFQVSLSVSPQNRIKLVVDKLEGIKIEECIQLSRLIEKSLDRDTEDFELEVTSPGIGQNFKVKQQYLKAVDKDVKITLNDNSEHKGKLKYADEEKLILEAIEKVKQEGQKKKKEILKDITLEYDQIKQAKEIINF